MKLANFLHLLLLLVYITAASSSSSEVLLIKRGFSTSPSQPPFHPILNEPSGVFSFGFLEVGSSQLDLAVIHLPSRQPVWRAIPASPASWDGSISLSFNGSLVLSDTRKGVVIWSTSTANGDSLVLLNSSNLQIQKKLGEATSVLWQSFDFPSDTIVQGQNFTSKAALFSENQKFSMSLGFNYLALYMEFNGVAAARPMYWKRTALQAKAQIIQGKGTIYARVDPIGFLGMYQTEVVPVDVLSFDTFNRGIPGLRRLTLESDGNLKAYYWDGSAWVLDFQAISELCELPSACGAYGLCQAEQPRCGCLDNSTSGCPPLDSGNLCSVGGDGYTVFRSKGVEMANKELANHLKVASLEECELSCEKNCSCWGAVYNNVSRFCYSIDYPIQTLAGVGDEQKTGYFKVRTTRGSSGGGLKNKAGMVLLLVAGVLVFLAAAGFGAYRVWKQRRRPDASTVECPYKDLKSGYSFRSIELSESFRK